MQSPSPSSTARRAAELPAIAIESCATDIARRTEARPLVNDTPTLLAQPVLIGRIEGVARGAFKLIYTADELLTHIASLGPAPVPDLAGGKPDSEDPSVTRIPLDYGAFALIDTDDYPLVKRYRWVTYERRYAFTSRSIGEGGKQVAMHRLVLMAGPDALIDHAYHDTLDNRKNNLRLCTSSQNNFNTRLSSANTSGIKGISPCSSGNGGEFLAAVRAENNIHQKRFQDLDSAVQWMVHKRRELHGAFACFACTEEMFPVLSKHLLPTDRVAIHRVGDESPRSQYLRDLDAVGNVGDFFARMGEIHRGQANGA